MLANKGPEAIVGPLRSLLASLTVVPVPGSEHHPAAAFGPDAQSAPDVATALRRLPADGADILIAGSLYLAGAVLAANGEIPD
jgi:dihydrofolate synthase / folylpolyglutamate synthase